MQQELLGIDGISFAIFLPKRYLRIVTARRCLRSHTRAIFEGFDRAVHYDVLGESHRGRMLVSIIQLHDHSQIADCNGKVEVVFWKCRPMYTGPVSCYWTQYFSKIAPKKNGCVECLYEVPPPFSRRENLTLDSREHMISSH